MLPLMMTRRAVLVTLSTRAVAPERSMLPLRTRSVAPPKNASARKEPVVAPVKLMLLASVRGGSSSGSPAASGCKVPLRKVMFPAPIAPLLPI